MVPTQTTSKRPVLGGRPARIPQFCPCFSGFFKWAIYLVVGKIGSNIFEG